MSGPNTYIPDLTEQDGPCDGPDQDETVYSDQDELLDEERRYDEKDR